MKKKKLPIKKIFSSKLFISVVFILAVFLVLAVGKSFLKRYQINREIETLKSEIAKLESNNQDLSELINYLQTDFFTEQEARLKLGLQKPGEQVVVVPEMPSGVALFSEKEYNEKALTNPQKWWNYFFTNQ